MEHSLHIIQSLPQHLLIAHFEKIINTLQYKKKIFKASKHKFLNISSPIISTEYTNF